MPGAEKFEPRMWIIFLRVAYLAKYLFLQLTTLTVNRFKFGEKMRHMLQLVIL